MFKRLIAGILGVVLVAGTAFGQISGVAPQLSLRETDQALPAGMYRLKVNGDALTIEHNTAAAGDYSTVATPLTITSASIIANDGAADIDFIHRSDTNNNHVVSNAGANGGVGSFGVGRDASSGIYFQIDPPAYTNPTGVSANYRVHIGNTAAMTTGAGDALSFAASLNVVEPNITLGGGGSINDAATVRIADAPTEGTRNMALWVASGISRFDGNIQLANTSSLYWNSRSIVSSQSDGSITLTNNAGNDFNRLTFGGTSSSYPALARSSNNLQVKLADNSAYTQLDALQYLTTVGKIGFNAFQSDSPMLRRSGITLEVRLGDDSAYAPLVVSDLQVNVGALYWASRSYVRSPADGSLTLYNNAQNSFGLLQFGGTSSSFPAWKRSSTALQARLADDSAYATVYGLDFIASSNMQIGSDPADTGSLRFSNSGSIVFESSDDDDIQALQFISSGGIDRIQIGTADVFRVVFQNTRTNEAMDTVASANDLILGAGNFFSVTGTTTINGIAQEGWEAGSHITIKTTDSLTLTHNGSPSAGYGKLLLEGGTNKSMTADDLIKLVFNGTDWEQEAPVLVK